MKILADCHLHTSFSGDSESPMEGMIEKAIAMGMETLCFTEHMDMDFPICRRRSRDALNWIRMRTGSALTNAGENTKERSALTSAWNLASSPILPGS